MAAANYKAVAKFHHLSGIPRDDVVNDWYFHWSTTGADPATSDFDKVRDALQQFYDGTGTGMTQRISYYLSEALSRAAGVDVTIYKLPAASGPLGSPVYTGNFAYNSAGTGIPYPAEIAACLSYASDYGSAVEFGAGNTRPRSSHRGRVYIGPLEGTVVQHEDSTTHDVRLDSVFQEDLAQSARLAFSVASPGLIFTGTDWTWGQFSHTHWLRQLVTSCWVDNEFDIQRRRGLVATTRTTKFIV